jgi:hypothetical protein
MAQWAEVFVPTDPEPGEDAGPEPQCLGPNELCDPSSSECCEGLTCVPTEAAAVCVVVGG